jgi:hypothetical protein
VRRGSAWLLVPIAFLAILLGQGTSGHAAGAAADPATAVLSTADLPRGYRTGYVSGCGPVIVTGESSWSPALRAIFVETRPQACFTEFKRAWASASIGPATVSSAAFVFADEAAARRTFAARADLTQFVHLKPSKSTNLDLGDEAVLLEGQGLNERGTAVVWRSGTVVALLATERADATTARSLAARQQELIAHPSARPAAPDETELDLDDPSLRLPVYWLGRTFAPGGGLPRLMLSRAEVVSTHPGEGPGNKVRLSYAPTARRPSAVSLALWTPAAWKRFAKTRLGRLIWDSPCARKSTLALPRGGRAEIFVGYGTPSPLTRPCPAQAPNRAIAHIYLPGVVVVVNMPNCYTCAAPSGLADPYGTKLGMLAIARALTIRVRKP